MDFRLLNALKNVGCEPLSLRFSNGSEILVLPYGGRILGLFAPDDSRNFLWTNPALENEETARELYASRQWPNSGGDRTWLAPEIDFFFPNFPDVTSYVQPSSLDPGSYRAESSATEVRMAMEFSLVPKSVGREVGLRLAKTVRAAANPLGSQVAVQYAGYSYENGDETHLIVRNFFVNPSGEYVDASWTDSSDQGYGVQACSANGVFGRFSELEYHVPAMTSESPFSSDVSQVWAYRGSRAQIREVSRLLLGVPG